MKIIPSDQTLTLSQWQQWLETLNHGDIVLYQQFITNLIRLKMGWLSLGTLTILLACMACFETASYPSLMT